MKLTHKQKVKMARRMRSQEEIREHTPIFLTKEWEKRKKSKAKKSYAKAKN